MKSNQYLPGCNPVNAIVLFHACIYSCIIGGFRPLFCQPESRALLYPGVSPVVAVKRV